MNFFESNYRHKLHSAGFHYIAEFTWRNMRDTKRFSEMVTALKQIYGPAYTDAIDPDSGRMIRTWNENWRSESNTYARRKRIYLKHEADMSLIMLRIS